MSAANKAEPSQQIHSSAPNLSQKAATAAANGKIDNENKLTENGINEASQDQVYVFDDAASNINNNNIDDDDEMQVKYLYSLLKNRMNNNI